MPKRGRRACPGKDPKFLSIYNTLFAAFGPQHWWPAATQFEVMVGAILTQNAAWPNVEKAIAGLKRAGCLSPRAILDLPVPRLERLLRPSGFFRVKARRLRSFVGWFRERTQGNVTRLRRVPLARLRPELLAVHGVGPETADSILLYALEKPGFVVDAYTRRILSRHGLIDRKAGYDEIARSFRENLPGNVGLYNEYHALFVRLAKTNCRARPQCEGCPLESLPGGGR